MQTWLCDLRRKDTHEHEQSAGKRNRGLSSRVQHCNMRLLEEPLCTGHQHTAVHMILPPSKVPTTTVSKPEVFTQQFTHGSQHKYTEYIPPTHIHVKMPAPAPYPCLYSCSIWSTAFQLSTLQCFRHHDKPPQAPSTRPTE